MIRTFMFVLTFLFFAVLAIAILEQTRKQFPAIDKLLGDEWMRYFMPFAFGMLGMLFNDILKGKLGSALDEPDENDDEPEPDDSATEIQKLKAACATMRKQADRLRKREATAIHAASRLLVSRMAYRTAIWFSIAHLVTGVAYGLLANQLSTVGTVAGPIRLLIEYSQTLLLVPCAATITVLHYARFVKSTHNLEFQPMWRLAGLGLVAAGGISLLMLTPEMLYAVAHFGSTPPTSILPSVPLLVFLTITRLMLFPSVGVVSCLFARSRLSRAIKVERI